MLNDKVTNSIILFFDLGLQTITHSGHLDVMHNPLGVFILAAGHFFPWIAIFALLGGTVGFQTPRLLN